MLLQERRRHLDVDLTLDSPLDDSCFVLTGREDDDLARVENRRDAHRERLTRDVFLTEEIGGGILAGDVVEVHETRPTLDARAWLVEADVPRLADAEELQVDPAGLTDRLLVPQALELNVLARDRKS